MSESVTSTLYLTKTDTIIEYVVKYKDRKVIDTLYVERDDVILELPIEQKHYSRDNVYDLWVSGYNVLLDSIYTYPKFEYQTITKETTRTFEKKTWGFYPYVGFKRFNNEFNPNIGIAFKSPKKWMYMVEIGLNGNGETFYGLNIGYNLK